MYSVNILTLKVLRKLYAKAFGTYQLPSLQREEDPDKASEMIYDLLASDKPCMIARFGANELNAVVNYLGVNSKSHSIFKYIIGEQPEWWWNKGIMYCMQNNAGFFPATPENMQRFGEMMIEDAKEVDLLGSWLNDESRVLNIIGSQPQSVHLMFLEPFWSNKPWTRALKNKKILVVHPFAELIEAQYNKREYLFEMPDVLPEFQLQTIKAVQSLGGMNNVFKDWFEALDYMKKEIDKRDYDVCLIGCGAYGFPLAAHVKRMGKKVVHIGGSLQLLFGIIGKRWLSKSWENPKQSTQLSKEGRYIQLMNQYWIRPDMANTPVNKDMVESGCYW